MASNGIEPFKPRRYTAGITMPNCMPPPLDIQDEDVTTPMMLSQAELAAGSTPLDADSTLKRSARKDSNTEFLKAKDSYDLFGEKIGSAPGGGLFGDLANMKEEVRRQLLKDSYDVKEFYHKEGIFQAIARHPHFEAVTLAIIAVNAIWMWIDTDYNGGSTMLDCHWLFNVVENLFCVYFTFEWFVRYMAFRRLKDGLKDNWFCFDSVLVFMMVAETWILTIVMLVVGGGGGLPFNASMLRLLRLARLSRMAKMLRSMPELLILCKGMTKASHTVVYVLVLMLILMYVFAIALVSLLRGKDSGDLYFPSIPSAIYTLICAGTFLDNLRVVIDDIGRDDTMAVAFFFVFVALSALMVLNMLIGVLCEVVSAVAETEKEEMKLTFVTETLQKVIDEIDENNDGMISKQEFASILKSKQAVCALSDVDVDPLSLVDFIDQIFEDKENDDPSAEEGGLKFEEFVEVILQYRGCNTATVKDVIDHRKWFTGHVEKELRKQRHLFHHILTSEFQHRGLGSDIPPVAAPRSGPNWETLSGASTGASGASTGASTATPGSRPNSRGVTSSCPVGSMSNGHGSSPQQSGSSIQSPTKAEAEEMDLLKRYQRLSAHQRSMIERRVQQLEKAEDGSFSESCRGLS